LIDQVTEDGAIGRTFADAPEIDGVVHLPDITDFSPGDLVEAEISAADDYDLWV
jgi:ribosomal protein S12 methylthiotransferase